MSTPRRWLCVAALLLSLAGCDCRGNKRTPAPPGDAGDAAAAADAAPTPAASPFVLVARGEFALRRARGGPAYAVAGRYPFTLDAKGTLTPMRALITEPVINAIGTIGASPEGVTYVEAVVMGSATDAPVTIGVAGAATYHVANGERFTGFFPWTEGAVLTLRSDAASNALVLPSSWHKARFEVLGGPKSKRVPKVPAAFIHADQFAAYPEGRVLLVAAERPSPDDPMNVGPAFVLDFGPSGVDAPKRIALPDAKLSQTWVSAGRSLADLIVYERGDPPTEARLLVLEGEAFVPIPLPLDKPLPIESLSRGDDGSLWITTGYYGSGDGYVRGGLYRVTITGKHADVARIRLPACDPVSRCAELEPQEVLAVSANDVWLTASAGGAASELELLHTQASAGPAGVYVIDNDRLEREAWAEVTPPPYRAGCDSALLVLGLASALDEKRVLEASRALGDLPAKYEAVRGRLGGEQVWAIESGAAEEKFKTSAGELAAWKKQIPSARLVCARLLVDRTVPLR